MGLQTRFLFRARERKNPKKELGVLKDDFAKTWQRGGWGGTRQDEVLHPGHNVVSVCGRAIDGDRIQ